MSLTVEEIVRQYMQQHGYTALYKDDCGCAVGDLMPCGDCPAEECTAGYENHCSTCAKGESCETRGFYDGYPLEPADKICIPEKCWVEEKP